MIIQFQETPMALEKSDLESQLQPRSCHISVVEDLWDHIPSWKKRVAVDGYSITHGWKTIIFPYLGVSKNRGTPKRMVYNGKPYSNGWFGVSLPIFGNIHFRKLDSSPQKRLPVSSVQVGLEFSPAWLGEFTCNFIFLRWLEGKQTNNPTIGCPWKWS